MDQKFSVQIYSTSFKLTVRKEQLDEGYSSNPEIEMEAKEQQCEPVLHGGAAREGFVQAGHPPPVQAGHPPPAQAKVKKKRDIGAKNRHDQAPPFLGSALHSSEADGGHLVKKINMPGECLHQVRPPPVLL